MAWQVRHQGSPRAVQNLTAEQIADGLRDGVWEPTDEVMGPGDNTWTAIETHPQFAELADELEPPETIHHAAATSLDMTALIDVCLVLLIFFILTTTYATAVQKVVPMATVQAQEGKKARLVSREQLRYMIRVEADLDRAGKPVVHVENQKVDVLTEEGMLDGDRLRDALQRYVRGGDGKTEIILDARQISWGTVIAIQDAARSAGVRKVHHLLRK